MIKGQCKPEQTKGKVKRAKRPEPMVCAFTPASDLCYKRKEVVSLMKCKGRGLTSPSVLVTLILTTVVVIFNNL